MPTDARHRGGASVGSTGCGQPETLATLGVAEILGAHASLRRLALGIRTVVNHLGSYWHTGIVVPDVEAATARLQRALGYRWGPPREVAGRMWTPQGEIDITLVYTYSTGSEPRLELVSGSPGSPWDPAVRTGADHVCYWSDDVARDSQQLEAHGMPVVVRHAGEAPRGFVYHQVANGFRLELMDRKSAEGIDAWMREEWSPGVNGGGGVG
jgi:catechol 2,3-dioxygenase-like lactoylglutathione lyase family enzyme